MRTPRTAVAAATAALALLGGAAGSAAADTVGPGSTGAKPPAGDGAQALCKRVPRIDARIERALKRLEGPATQRGSLARLQRRVDNAEAAGHTAIATYLKDRLAFRTSLVTTLNQREHDLEAVRTWCAAHHHGDEGAAK